MIKLIVALDDQHTIGSSTTEANTDWFSGLDPSLQSALRNAYQTADGIAVGHSSFSSLLPLDKKGFVLTRSNNHPNLPKSKLKACSEIEAVVKKHLGSSDDFAIVGGATLFDLFLPHAAVLDLYFSNTPLSGDLKFSAWNDGSFDLVDEVKRDGYVMKRMFRI